MREQTPQVPASRGEQSVGPTISVVICAYTQDRWSLLLASIHSVLKQDYPVEKLVVCIDHNPELFKMCLDHVGEWRCDSSCDIVVVENRHNGRLGSARNTGVEEVESDVIAFLDDDAIAEKEWLQVLAGPYSDPHVVAVGGAPLPVFATSRPRWLPPQLDWVFGCYYEGLPTTLAPTPRLIGANMSVRRSRLLEIGGFHSDNHDDMDMCHRLVVQDPSYKLLMEPRAVVHHIVPAERVTWSYLWRRIFTVNRGKVFASATMGDAASFAADVSFVKRAFTGAVRMAVADAVPCRDPFGLVRLGALVAGIGLAGLGHLAGRISLAMKTDGRGFGRHSATEKL